MTVFDTGSGIRSFQVAVSVPAVKVVDWDAVAEPVDLTVADACEDKPYTLSDAVMILRMPAGLALNETVFREDDIDGDNRIGLGEVDFIFQSVAGLRN